MKRIAMLLLKRAWRLAGPVRRPLVRKLDARIETLIANTVNARLLPELIPPLGLALERLERIEAGLARAEHAGAAMAEEVDLVLNGVSREVFRLQVQVDSLRRTLDRDARRRGPGLALMADDGDEGDEDGDVDGDGSIPLAPAADRQSKVG